MRWRTVVGIFIVAGGSLALMVHIKTDVGALVDERRLLIKQQRILKETVKVQQAEWVHLTRARRLGQFADDMGLEDVKVQQIIPVVGLSPEVGGDML